MAGFMSSNVSLTIFAYDQSAPLDVEALRKGAFRDAVDPDGLKYGWTGLGELLDTENFFLAQCDSRFSGFSWRQDSRKIAQAVVRLQLKEKIRAEELAGGKVGGKRKKEMKEAIEANLLAQAEFIPSLTDCIWDAEKGRLFIASQSENLLERILKNFDQIIKGQGQFLASEVDMASLFAKIQAEDGAAAGEFSVQPLGSARLVSMGLEEKSAVTAENNSEAVSRALNQGMNISKMGLIATRGEEEITFTLADDLKVSKLKLPKPEKGADEEATFLINADICAKVDAIIETLTRA